MMSLNSFSQTVTDSTKIQLTKPVARLVIKDLITGDQLLLQYKALEDVLAETNNKLETQSLLVVNLQQQVANLDSANSSLKQKYDVQAQLSSDLEKALKAQKRKTFFYKVGSAVGAAAVILRVLGQ